MFLCEVCHDNEKCFHFSGSYGRCEGCGKTAGCVDCHNLSTPIRRPRRKRAKPKVKQVEVKPLALPANVDPKTGLSKPIKPYAIVTDHRGRKWKRTLH